MKQLRSAIIMVKLTRESLAFAYQAIVVNKLRTFLSLFGITIGIFAIISVFTMVDSLEKNVRDSIQSLGDNVIYVQKWPWSMSNDYPWWKYMNRPQPTVEDLNAIRAKSALAKNSVLCLQVNSLVKFQKNSAPNTGVMAVSNEYEEIRSFEIAQGRYFSPFELHSGRNVAIIGSELATELFEGTEPVGKTIKIGGKKLEVIGIFLKEGKSAIGENSHDNLVVIPINYAKTFVDFRRVGLWIMVKASEGASTLDLNDELRGILRTVRKLKPVDDDNFALNEISMLKQGIDNIFKMIDLAGWIIGGFSIIVGGFGIANIMFVSVKERTNIIGIQKALGAKNYFILIQFLYESVLLSTLGGIIGLLLIFAGTLIISNTSDFSISLTAANIIRGLGISGVIGIVSGFAPAWSASRLSPVEAINSKG